ncbi:MAG TPA: hypothetical protein VFP84_34780 [Kofleriaceae bacterium]|nr:hypothetical protein [Kofleriaceae bacterium]
MLRTVLRLASFALVACGRREPPPPDRPSQPSLTVAVDAAAPTTGRRIVAVGQIAQPWHTGAWSPASITLADVAAGDAIVVLGAYWGDLEAGASTLATDDHGALVRVIDQGPAIVGRKKPPVFAQLLVELDPAPGPHTITPPYLGGVAGDGTMYVVQIRGLTERRVVALGERRITGAALADISVTSDGAAADGDLVIALAGYDNTAPHAPGWSHPPPGWRALGVQDDGANNVPSELCARVATVGPQTVTWTWQDPTVNVAAAVIAAIR